MVNPKVFSKCIFQQAHANVPSESLREESQHTYRALSQEPNVGYEPDLVGGVKCSCAQSFYPVNVPH